MYNELNCPKITEQFSIIRASRDILNSPREAFLSAKLTQRPPRPNAIKTILETRSNQPSPLEGVVYIWCIINVAINIKVTFVRYHWNDKTKPFVYILRMLHIVCKKWLAVSQTLSIFFQSLFNNIILLWRPIAEYGQSNEPLAHAVLTASIQSYLPWSIDREGGFRMTVVLSFN